MAKIKQLKEQEEKIYPVTKGEAVLLNNDKTVEQSLGERSITTEQLADFAVAREKIADGAVGDGKIADKAVKFDNIDFASFESGLLYDKFWQYRSFGDSPIKASYDTDNETLVEFEIELKKTGLFFICADFGAASTPAGGTSYIAGSADDAIFYYSCVHSTVLPVQCFKLGRMPLGKHKIRFFYRKANAIGPTTFINTHTTTIQLFEL